MKTAPKVKLKQEANIGSAQKRVKIEHPAFLVKNEPETKIESGEDNGLAGLLGESENFPKPILELGLPPKMTQYLQKGNNLTSARPGKRQLHTSVRSFSLQEKIYHQVLDL